MDNKPTKPYWHSSYFLNYPKKVKGMVIGQGKQEKAIQQPVEEEGPAREKPVAVPQGTIVEEPVVIASQVVEKQIDEIIVQVEQVEQLEDDYCEDAPIEETVQVEAKASEESVTPETVNVEEVKEAKEVLQTASKPVESQANLSGKQEESKEELLAEAVKLHDFGVKGDKEAVVQAHDLLKKLRRLSPDDPSISAYFGSITTLLGRDAVDPTKRFKNSSKGLEILDSVVNNNPDDIQVRILRGNVCFRLPEMYFHRTATAIEDFQYLIERYEQDSTIFTAGFYRQILENLSQAYKNLGRVDASKVIQEKLATLAGEAKSVERVEKQEMDWTKKIPAGQEIAAMFGGEKKAPIEVSSPVPAADKNALLKEGLELHARAIGGNKTARSQAYNLFNQAYQADPEDKLIAAYYADCLTLTGLDSGDMGTMFPSIFKAVKILNNAVISEPNNLQIRFLRAYQNFRLPEAIFHKTATAREDFEYLAQRYEQDNTSFSQETYWQILYDLAIVYKRLDMGQQAKATLEKLYSLDPKRAESMKELGKAIIGCEFARAHPLQDYLIFGLLEEK